MFGLEVGVDERLSRCPVRLMAITENPSVGRLAEPQRSEPPVGADLD